MAALLDKIMDIHEFLFGSQADIRMLGFDAVGKTTILYRLKLNETLQTISTVGFNVETIQLKNYSFTLWDVRGSEKIRPLWKHYLPGTDGLVFVVDSADQESFSEVQMELGWILKSVELAGVPLLVLANKQDLPKACSPETVAPRLGLNELEDRSWHIQGTSAVSGDGLYEAMETLAGLVAEFQRRKRTLKI